MDYIELAKALNKTTTTKGTKRKTAVAKTYSDNGRVKIVVGGVTIDVPCIGAIKAGDTVTYETQNGMPVAVGYSGWGDSVKDNIIGVAVDVDNVSTELADTIGFLDVWSKDATSGKERRLKTYSVDDLKRIKSTSPEYATGQYYDQDTQRWGLIYSSESVSLQDVFDDCAPDLNDDYTVQVYIGTQTHTWSKTDIESTGYFFGETSTYQLNTAYSTQAYFSVAWNTRDYHGKDDYTANDIINNGLGETGTGRTIFILRGWSKADFAAKPSEEAYPYNITKLYIVADWDAKYAAPETTSWLFAPDAVGSKATSSIATGWQALAIFATQIDGGNHTTYFSVDDDGDEITINKSGYYRIRAQASGNPSSRLGVGIFSDTNDELSTSWIYAGGDTISGQVEAVRYLGTADGLVIKASDGGSGSTWTLRNGGHLSNCLIEYLGV